MSTKYLSPIRIPRKEDRTLQYQVQQNGVGVDITGYTIYLSVKASARDTAYKIGPIAGVVNADQTTYPGYFTVTITAALSTVDPFKGVFSLVMKSPTLQKTTLTPPGGMGFEVFDDIYDG